MRTHVVILVDKAVNAGSELSLGRVFLNVDLLSLQAAEPPFNHNVVRPAGLSVHALPDMQRFEQGLIVIAGELAALVGVDDRRDAVALHRFTDCFQDGGRFQGIGQPPTHDLAAVPVNDRSQVHVVAFHPDVGDVDRPHLIRELSHITPEQVRKDSFLILALREVWPRIDRVDSHLAHVLLHRLPGYIVPVVSQQHANLSGTPRRILGMPVIDECHDPLLALNGLFIRGLGRMVYPRARYAQKFALSPDRQVTFLLDQIEGRVALCGERHPGESLVPASAGRSWTAFAAASSPGSPPSASLWPLPSPDPRTLGWLSPETSSAISGSDSD